MVAKVTINPTFKVEFGSFPKCFIVTIHPQFMKLFFYFFYSLFGLSCSAQGLPSFSINEDAVGIIYSGQTAVATGFVIRAPDTLLTCAHVFKENPTASIFKTANKMVKFSIIKIFPEYDLAILKAEEKIVDTSLLAAKKIDLQKGRIITQIGLDTSRSQGLHKVVTAYGTRLEGQEIIDYKGSKVSVITFYSEARPGYSGGPIFNMNGEIIAFTARYASKVPAEDGRFLVQGFSIVPVKAFIEQLK